MSIIYIESIAAGVVLTSPAPLGIAVTGERLFPSPYSIAAGLPQNESGAHSLAIGTRSSGDNLASLEVYGERTESTPLSIEVGLLAPILDAAPFSLSTGEKTIAPAPLGIGIAGRIGGITPASLTVRAEVVAAIPLTIETATGTRATVPASIVVGATQDTIAPASLEVQGGESVTIIVDIADSVVIGARGDCE